MPMTRESPIKRPADCSTDEFNRACEFLKKIKEMDKERNHRGIYIRSVTALKLYYSRSLNMIDLKNRLTTIFKKCDVLLAEFDRILLKGLDTVPRPDVDDVDAWSKIEQLTKFITALRSVSEDLREEFLKAFTRYKEHGNVLILKRKVNKVLQDYPCLKKEFKRFLIYSGLILQDVITSDEEDVLWDKDMYFHAIKSANEFTMANDKENPPPPVGVCGAVRRFYEERDWPYPQESMRDDPKLVVRRILPSLKRKYKDLMLKDERKAFEKVQKVNESLLVFVDKSPEAIYETTEVLSTWKRRKSRSKN